MTHHRLGRALYWVLLMALFFLLAPDTARQAQAADLYVANNGTDGPACGPVADPCRSPSRAIANANAGDRIVVGPGRYGDLDNNGVLGGAGEETGGAGCSCAVLIDKQLTLESRDGSSVTILDSGTAIVDFVVQIAAGSAVFGTPGKGFTVVGSKVQFAGVGVSPGIDGVRVESNTVVGLKKLAGDNAYGFRAEGGNGHTFTGNLATGNTGGFLLFNGAAHLLTHNTATANTPNPGFNVTGTAHILVKLPRFCGG